MCESIYFLKPAWCGTHRAGLLPEQDFQSVTVATAFRRWFSLSPEYSRLYPNFKVWFPRTLVSVSPAVQIVPEECDGYGPPAKLEKFGMVTVGILLGSSLPLGIRYG